MQNLCNCQAGLPKSGRTVERPALVREQDDIRAKVVMVLGVIPQQHA